MLDSIERAACCARSSSRSCPAMDLTMANTSYVALRTGFPLNGPTRPFERHMRVAFPFSGWACHQFPPNGLATSVRPIRGHVGPLSGKRPATPAGSNSKQRETAASTGLLPRTPAPPPAPTCSNGWKRETAASTGPLYRPAAGNGRASTGRQHRPTAGNRPEASTAASTDPQRETGRNPPGTSRRPGSAVGPPRRWLAG